MDLPHLVCAFSILDDDYTCFYSTFQHIVEHPCSKNGCVLLHAQVENSSFESCWEEGLYSVSTGCPLMGYPCQDPGEEGSPAGRSFDLVESVSRSLEMVAPEALQILANVSRFETAPSDACSSPLFSIFGRPLLIGGSSSLGDFHGHEALGEVEPLRVASVDGTE